MALDIIVLFIVLILCVFFLFILPVLIPPEANHTVVLFFFLVFFLPAKANRTPVLCIFIFQFILGISGDCTSLFTADWWLIFIVAIHMRLLIVFIVGADFCLRVEVILVFLVREAVIVDARHRGARRREKCELLRETVSRDCRGLMC